MVRNVLVEDKAEQISYELMWKSFSDLVSPGITGILARDLDSLDEELASGLGLFEDTDSSLL
jgi:hypothetical protein